MINVLKRVFFNVWYLILALGVAFTVVSAALLLPNFTALIQVVTSATAGFEVKMSYIFALYGSLATNFTFWSASYLLLVGLLFGINISLLVYYIKRRRTVSGDVKASAASVSGMISAMFGIGCAACGSVVLTSFLGLIGAGSLLVYLPLQGLEFGLIGLILLLVSISYLSKRINDPLVCPIEL